LLRNAVEIDDRMTRAVLQALAQDPRLNPGGGVPAVKVATEVA
jgi:hypothetical protein